MRFFFFNKPLLICRFTGYVIPVTPGRLILLHPSIHNNGMNTQHFYTHFTTDNSIVKFLYQMHVAEIRRSRVHNSMLYVLCYPNNQNSPVIRHRCPSNSRLLKIEVDASQIMSLVHRNEPHHFAQTLWKMYKTRGEG